MIARKPASSSAHGACSRLEPEPKFAPEVRMGLPTSTFQSGASFASWKRYSPKPVRSTRFMKRAGMIWSVSTSS